MSIHKSKTWIENAEILKNGKVCEWCGSPNELCVHHPTDKFPSPSKIRSEMNGLIYSEFKKRYEEKYKDENKSVKTDKHKHVGVLSYHLISTQHKFEYDKSTEIIQYKKQKPTEKEKERFRKEFRVFKNKNKIKNEIETLIKKADERYVSLQDTVVICKKCHFMAHKGYNICPKCKKGYKKKEYPTCFDCLPEKRKREIDKYTKFIDQFEKRGDDFL